MSALREALRRAGLATQEQAAKADEEAKKRAEEHEHRQREAREAEEALERLPEQLKPFAFLVPEKWRDDS